MKIETDPKDNLIEEPEEELPLVVFQKIIIPIISVLAISIMIYLHVS